MTIIEQAIVGKVSQEACEDGLAVNDGFVAVIDGSTSKTPIEINPGMSNGRYCMELVKRYVCSMTFDTSVESFCTGVTEFLRSAVVSAGCNMSRLKECPTERPAASAVVYSVSRRQVWMVGDCQCIVDGVLYENKKPQEDALATKRSEYLLRAMAAGLEVADIQANDPGRKHIINELVESCKGQNVTYSVIDGFDIPLDKVKVIDVRGGGDVILASDGYPFLKGTLVESEEALAALLRDDPLCVRRFKATKGLMKGNKSFDDRCYVRFSP